MRMQQRYAAAEKLLAPVIAAKLRNVAPVLRWIGETRNYVQRVLENLQVYRLMLGDRAKAFELVADLRR